MLRAVRKKNEAIERVLRKDDRLYLYSAAGIHRLEPKDDRTVRITYTHEDTFLAPEKENPEIVYRGVYSGWDFFENDLEIVWYTRQLKIVIDRQTASYRYYDGQGKLLLKERETNSKSLEAFETYKLLEDEVKTEKISTPDGAKEILRKATKVPDGQSYHTRLHISWQEGEALYGLGQHEEGFASLRGENVQLHQGNRRIAIPLLLSSLGYGILTNTGSPMIFSDTIHGSYLYAEACPEMDYFFINGSNMGGVVKEYRKLTGKAALLPRWAYGYIQSQERYETQQEILDTAEEYRRRGIGLDAIVLDWMSWDGEQWGQKTFDGKRFPKPGQMIETLHNKHIHFMISIWPNMDEHTEDYKEFKNRGMLLPGTCIYNALDKNARKLYWEQIRRGLLCHGIDAWWCDNSEPFTPEWNHREKVEPAKLYEEYCQMAGAHLPAERTNAYVLYHAMAVYEGQRADSRKRVVNLTRSAYTGMQRYGTISWSGDISASWDTLKKQVAESLHFCASGLPFWTVDIGAFFVKEGNFWYWNGEYEKGTEDLGYRELFVRWYQWGCFLPVFRGHGTDCRRELWNFANADINFYDAILDINRLRYRLLPYIYSAAGKCWIEDSSMIRFLAFDYAEDDTAKEIVNQYLFGESLMVCPVLMPMYYDRESKPLNGVAKEQHIYLPQGNGWYDFWNNRYYEGGQWIVVEAPLNKIPLFVKEGSLIPVVREALSTEELSNEIDMIVYEGKANVYTLYEDSGDGYGYEKGEYRLTELSYDVERKKLVSRLLHSGWGENTCYKVNDTIVIKKQARERL